MSRMQRIRTHAPALLEATKESLRWLLRGDPLPIAAAEEKRQKLIAHLRDVIEAADPPNYDDISSSIKLTMTRPTAKVILNELEKRAAVDDQDGLVLGAVQEGIHWTKQRVYMVLGINHAVLRRLCHILKTTSSSHQEKAFKRLVDQIEEEGLSKNPMEVLAKTAL